MVLLFIHLFSVSLVSCLEGSTATEIIATIRAEINGADILQLTAYNQAGDTPESAAECTTLTITNDILQLDLTFDTGSPTCGIAAVRHRRRKRGARGGGGGGARPPQ